MLAVAAAFLIGYSIYTYLVRNGLLIRQVPPASQYAALGLLFGVGVTGFGLLTGSYRSGTSVLHYVETRGAVRAVWLTAAFLFAALFLLKMGSEFSRLLLTLAVVTSTATITVVRRLVAPLIAIVQHSGERNRRVAIAGAGETARLVMKKMAQAPTAGLELVGFLDDYIPPGSKLCCRLRQGHQEQFEVAVLGRTWDLREVSRQFDVQLLLLAMSDLSREAVDDIVSCAQEIGLELGFVPSLGDVRADQLGLHDLTAIPILSRSPIRTHLTTDPLKRAIDLCVAVPLFLVTLPLWLVAAVAIRLDSPGPVLFRQVRVGLDGRAFVMLKFRTMRTDTQPFSLSPTSELDPRVTRVGRWFRLSGIDEIPQLLNVLKGDMSIVGPRPEMPFIVEQYTDLEQTRLHVKPGITGLWQLSPDRDAQIHDNIEYDLYYVRNRGLLLDALILLETVLFTVGLVARRIAYAVMALWSRRDSRSSGASDPVGGNAGLHPASYLLLALDQRVRGGAGKNWAPCLAAASTAAGDNSVKVLVAPRNMAAMTEVLSTSRMSEAGESHQEESEPEIRSEEASPDNLDTSSGFEFVPYRGTGEVAAWATSARIVVTDIRDVRDRVRRDESRTVVFLDDSGEIRAEGPSENLQDPFVGRLVEALEGNSRAG
jgi:exopolysaccharide biosynthesis polyprenyl glycosylphosphotransferase